MILNTYLNFSGNCEAALNFYKDVLGAKVSHIYPFKGSPMESDIPANQLSKIMHAEFEIAGQTFMACDDIRSEAPGSMQGFSVSINTQSTEEADRVFNALSKGGQVIMPMQSTFWAAKFGMLVDQFGTPWMVNCEQAA